MLVALAATLLLSPEEPTSLDAVTFHSHAKRASILLPELGEQIGQKLLADKRAGDMVLYVSVKDVDPDMLFEKIAWATYSDWIRNDDGSRTLTYSDVQEHEREDELASDLRTTVASWAKSAYVGQPEEFTVQEAEQLAFWLQGLPEPYLVTSRERAAGMAGRLPAHRLLKRLIPLIDYSQVVPSGEQTFSTSQNHWSMPLHKSADALLDDYRREIAMMATALESYGLAVSGLPLDSRENRVVTASSPERVDVTVNDQLFIIRISGPIYEGPLDYGYLSSDGEYRTARNPYSTDWARRLPVDLRIGFSSDTQALVTMRRQLAVRQDQTERAKMLRPLKRDPLSFVASDGLDALAGTLERNVVAVLMDERRLLWAPSTSNDSVAIAWLLDGLDRHQYTFDDEWLAFRMPNPQTDRKNQMDRAMLGSALRNTVKDGRYMIDDLLAFWPEDSDSARFEAYYQGVGVLLPPTTERILNDDNDFLSFLASLTSLELQLVTGPGLTVSQLAPAARAALQKLHFANGDMPDIDRLEMFYSGVPQSALLRISFERTEPTAILEVLPEEAGIGWYYNFFHAKSLSYDRRYLFRNDASFSLTIEMPSGNAQADFRYRENGFGLTPTHYDDLPVKLQEWFKESSETERKKRGGGS